jgi:uncharacterized protein (TIGR03067 family)
VDKNLPARPNLDHLRRQAKALLAELRNRDARSRLADAQLQIARQNGFPSWPVLSRHIELLRSLEGDWRFTSLEVDGAAVAPDMLGQSRLLIDGDRFRTESPEANWEGIFTVDAEASPAAIDIEFVSGPDAGETCHGIFRLDGDSLQLCLGVVGAPRPEAFATRAGSGHALERLHRASKARPAEVTGGTPPPPAPPVEVDRAEPAAFAQAMTPLLGRLQGEWAAVQLVTADGKSAPASWLTHGSRIMTGNQVKVVFGGQTVVHALIRIDETARPVAIDYLDLRPKTKGQVSRGILEWIGDEVCFLMAPPGSPRPAALTDPTGKGTLSRWRRRP